MADRKKPAKKSAKKRASKQALRLPDSKVVSILKGMTAKPKAVIKVSRKLPFAEQFYAPKGNPLDLPVNPYERLTDPLTLRRYHQRNELLRPSDDLIRAICKLIRLGVPTSIAFAAYGVHFGTYKQWLQRAQTALDGDIVDDVFRELFECVEIAEAQGEVGIVLDARMNPDLTDFLMKTRYRRNFGKNAEGAAAQTFEYRQDKVGADMTPEEGAYIMSLLTPASKAVIDVPTEESDVDPEPTGTDKPKS